MVLCGVSWNSVLVSKVSPIIPSGCRFSSACGNRKFWALLSALRYVFIVVVWVWEVGGRQGLDMIAAVGGLDVVFNRKAASKRAAPPWEGSNQTRPKSFIFLPCRGKLCRSDIISESDRRPTDCRLCPVSPLRRVKGRFGPDLSRTKVAFV